VLDDVTAGDLEPGSNLPEAAGEFWRFLLPTLTPRRVAFLGRVSPAVRDALTPTGTTHAAMGAPSSAGGLDLVVAAIDGPGQLGASGRDLLGRLSPDAAVVLGRGAATRRTQRAVAELVGTSAPVARPLVLRPVARRSRSWSERANRFRGTDPALAAAALIVPAQAGRATRRRLLHRGRAALRLLRIRLALALRPGRVPAASRGHPSDPVPLRPARQVRIPRRAGTLIVPGVGADAPPAWLRAALRDSGVDAEGMAWAMAPPGGYLSKKVLFMLGHDLGEPELVVKVTQDPRFNARLDTEVAALRQLVANNLVDRATVPQVLGTSEHAGLRIAVQTAWRGQPFRALSTARIDCPFAGRALAWFTELGQRSARPDSRPAAARTAELDALLARFDETFMPDRDQRAALREHAAQVARHEVPTVFFHGDPGNWNLLARPDGTVGVLDWENAHPGGPPAWDVALFLATYGSFMAQARGRRYTPATFEAQLQPQGELRELWDATLRDYSQRVGVDPAATGSLVVLCWVHQALKEASRLPRGRAAGSHHHDVVCRVLAHPSLMELPGT
jgi:hypothetical protein